MLSGLKLTSNVESHGGTDDLLIGLGFHYVLCNDLRIESKFGLL